MAAILPGESFSFIGFRPAHYPNERESVRVDELDRSMT